MKGIQAKTIEESLFFCKGKRRPFDLAFEKMIRDDTSISPSLGVHLFPESLVTNTTSDLYVLGEQRMGALVTSSFCY